jgi:hypothetical protein
MVEKKFYMIYSFINYTSLTCEKPILSDYNRNCRIMNLQINFEIYLKHRMF